MILKDSKMFEENWWEGPFWGGLLLGLRSSLTVKLLDTQDHLTNDWMLADDPTRT